MPRFTVAPEIFELFPRYLVACVAVESFNNSVTYPLIDAQLAGANEEGISELQGLDPKALHEVAVWREAFQRVGWSASMFQSSIEAIIRRVMKGNPIPSISPLVDLGNAASLRHRVPVGAHDVDTWDDETLVVRHAVDDDTFHAMGSDRVERPKAGEIVYASGTVVRTRRWVWRQSQQALIGPATTRAFYPIDGFVGVTDAAVRAAQREIVGWFTEIGAQCKTAVVTKNAPEFRVVIRGS